MQHRITLVRGEMVEVDGYGYVFEDIVLENEDLEVGDGYVGAVIASILVRENRRS